MDWVKFVISLLNEKGYKIIELALVIILLIMLFISPSFAFLFLYNHMLFNSINFVWSILLILVFSSLLFVFLFVVRSLGNIALSTEEDNNREIINYNIIITMVNMGIIAIFLFLIYSIKLIYNGDKNIRFNIISLLVVITLVVLKDIIKFIKHIALLVVSYIKEIILCLKIKYLQYNNNKLKK